METKGSSLDVGDESGLLTVSHLLCEFSEHSEGIPIPRLFCYRGIFIDQPASHGDADCDSCPPDKYGLFSLECPQISLTAVANGTPNWFPRAPKRIRTTDSETSSVY